MKKQQRKQSMRVGKVRTQGSEWVRVVCIHQNPNRVEKETGRPDLLEVLAGEHARVGRDDARRPQPG